MDKQIAWRKHKPIKFPIDNQDQYRGQPYSLELPNSYLREASSVSDLGIWYSIGEAWAQIATNFIVSDEPTVLDLGCGCGKMARFFYLNPKLRYIGLDIFKPSILWCQKAFENVPRFRFEHLDVRSKLYNPQGSLDGATVKLPVLDSSVDMIICGSLFTHLLEPEFYHYMSEITRILNSQGTALVSIHDRPPTGMRFSGDVTRIDIAPEYFSEIVTSYDLQVRHHIGNVFGQQVYLLERTPK